MSADPPSAARPGPPAGRGRRTWRATATALLAAAAVAAALAIPGADGAQDALVARTDGAAAPVPTATADSTGPDGAALRADPTVPDGAAVPDGASAAGLDSTEIAATDGTAAPEPAPSRHWYMVATQLNGCRLNLRAGPSTGHVTLLRLSACDKGAWCWFQLSDCGRAEPPEVVGGTYTCRDGQGDAVTSDRWTVVALTSDRRAFVASRCGWARRL